jgi:hypothetical protein
MTVGRWKLMIDGRREKQETGFLAAAAPEPVALAWAKLSARLTHHALPSGGRSPRDPPMREPLRPAAQPITEDDAFLAEALESASIPTLMMSIVHLTGDASLLDGPIRPAPVVMGELQGSLSEDDKAAVRAMALDALRGYRDGGCQLPPPPSPETIRRMKRSSRAFACS